MRDKLFKFFGLFSSFVLLFLIASILEGFVLSYLWEWFVVPLGLRSISILHAIGICVLLDFITYHYYDYKRSAEVGFMISIIYILIRPVVTMIVGAFVRFWM